MLLEGPGRWHARAHAEIGFLFFSVSGTLELRWGSSDEEPPPAVTVAAEVREALEQPPVWAHVLPAAGQRHSSCSEKAPMRCTRSAGCG